MNTPADSPKTRSGGCAARHSKVHPKTFARKGPLLNKDLVILLRQIQADYLHSLFAHFVINTEAIRKEMFHCIGQVT